MISGIRPCLPVSRGPRPIRVLGPRVGTWLCPESRRRGPADRQSGLNGALTFTYDARGNQTGAGAGTFGYDLADRLKTTGVSCQPDRQGCAMPFIAWPTVNCGRAHGARKPSAARSHAVTMTCGSS